MEGKYNEIELLFIREILDQHGEYLFDLLSEGIESKALIKEGVLLDSLHYKVSMRGNNPVLSYYFVSHGRFIEIRYFKKSQNTRQWKTVNTEKELWKIRSKEDRLSRKKKKKDTNWYTRNVYGSQNRLIGRIGSEFTTEEITRLKNILSLQKDRGYQFSQITTSGL